MQNITERRQAEPALDENEELYRLIAENSPAGIVVHVDNKIVYGNQAALKIIGGDHLETLLGKPVLDFVHPDDRAAIAGLIQAAITTDFENEAANPISVEERLIRLDGTIVTVEASAIVIHYRGKTGLLVIMNDITERKQVEEALRVEHERFERFVESNIVGIAIADAAGNIITANDCYLKILGVTRQDLAEGKVQWNKFTPPEWLPADERAIRELREFGVCEPYEKEYVRADGSRVPVYIADAMLPGPGEQIAAFVLDITECKQAEDDLRKQKEILQKIFDHIPLMINFIGEDGNIKLVNREWERTLGWTLEEVQEKKLDILVDLFPDAEDREKAFDFLVAAPMTWGEFRPTVRDGRVIDTSWRETRLSDGTNIGIGQDITERKQAEESLRRSEERYRSLFENMLNGYACCQMLFEDGRPVDFIYQDVNSAFEKLTGLKNVEGKKVTEVIPGIRESNPDIFEIYGRVALTGEPERFEDFFEPLSAWLSISVYSIERGTFVAVFDNVSERKQAEKALRQSEQRLALHIQKTPLGVIEFDPDHHVIQWNPAAERMFGYSAGQAIGQHATFFVPDSAREQVDRVLRDLQELKGGEWSRNENITADGRIIQCEWYNTPLVTPDGKFIGVTSLVQDITGHVQAEKDLLQYQDHLEELVKERTTKLAESEASLFRHAEEINDLYQNAPCGYHSLDEDGTFLRINDTELKMLGYSREELIGKKKFRDLMTRESMFLFDRRFPAFKEQGFANNLEFEMIRKDGTILPIVLHATAVKDAEGHFIMTRTTVLDNTERLRAEKALHKGKEAAESANRAKSSFLANMSHEIRTPMNAILGFTQLMMRDSSLTSHQRQHLRTVQRSGEHLLELINEILEMSKIEANRITLNLTHFDLTALIRELETMFNLRTDAKGLEFRVESANDLPQYVIGDENKLRQIFINLLSNAVKFTDQGGITWRIQVAREKKGKFQLVSEVEDTGPGIAAEELSQLFKPFGQTLAGIREGGGTGLGLAISSKYAQLMGGDLTVTSEPGKGSTFRITISAAVGNSEDVASTLPLQRVLRLKEGQVPYRILVVDDQMENRVLVTEMLRGVGFLPREACNGEEAVRSFEQWKPHLILMDMRMPVMDGYEAIRRIKSTDRGRRTPIIAVTASAFVDDEKRSFEVGANAYLRKPFREQELFSLIGSHLGVHYEYEEEPLEDKHLKEVEVKHTSIEVLVDLPPDSISEIRQATLSANLDKLLELIEGVARYSPAAAKRMRECADNYQYEQLLRLLP